MMSVNFCVLVFLIIFVMFMIIIWMNLIIVGGSNYSSNEGFDLLFWCKRNFSRGISVLSINMILNFLSLLVFIFNGGVEYLIEKMIMMILSILVFMFGNFLNIKFMLIVVIVYLN